MIIPPTLSLCICPESKALEMANELLKKQLAAYIDIIPGNFSLNGWNDEQPKGQVIMLITLIDYDGYGYYSDNMYTEILRMHTPEIPILIDLDPEEIHSDYYNKIIKHLYGEDDSLSEDDSFEDE